MQTLPWLDRWCCSVLTKPFLDLIGDVAWCSPKRHHWQKYAGHHCLQSVWRRSSTTHAKVHNLNSLLNPSCSKYFQHCTEVLLSEIVNCNSYFMWYQNPSGCCVNLLECSQLEEKNLLWSFWPSTAWRNHKFWGVFVVVCRRWYGYFHVVKNNCTQWGMYAVGGSEAPTINSEGNRSLAPGNCYLKEVRNKELSKSYSFICRTAMFLKSPSFLIHLSWSLEEIRYSLCNNLQLDDSLGFCICWRKCVNFLKVTKCIDDGGGKSASTESWNWWSSGDFIMNGAYFISSGATSVNAPYYAKATSFNACPVNMVESMTAESGPIWCVPAMACWWSRQTFFCVFSDSRASLVHVGIQFISACIHYSLVDIQYTKERSFVGLFI